MDLQYGALFRIDEIKASDSGWSCSGYASTFGNIDHGGDVVMRGAFDTTLAEWKAGRNKIRFLNAHRTDQVLGLPTSLVADDRGLLGTFKISKTALGEDVHTLLQDGAIDSFSIGFIPTEVEFDDIGVRKLMAVDLLEVSVVAIPMNDQAAVTRVKADVPFLQMLARSVEHLKLGTEEARALQARRASDKRELNEAQVAAIKELYGSAEALLATLNELLIAPAAEAPGDLKLRLELARRLSQRRGHLQETAA